MCIARSALLVTIHKLSLHLPTIHRQGFAQWMILINKTAWTTTFDFLNALLRQTLPDLGNRLKVLIGPVRQETDCATVSEHVLQQAELTRLNAFPQHL